MIHVLLLKTLLAVSILIWPAIPTVFVTSLPSQFSPTHYIQDIVNIPLLKRIFLDFWITFIPPTRNAIILFHIACLGNCFPWVIAPI